MVKKKDEKSTLNDMKNSSSTDVEERKNMLEKYLELNEKLFIANLASMQKSFEICVKFANESVENMSNASSDPSYFRKAIEDFAAAQPGVAAENVAALSKAVKNYQLNVTEMLMATGGKTYKDLTFLKALRTAQKHGCL